MLRAVAPCDQLEGGGKRLGRQVVEQNPRDPCLERFGDVVERLRLDLDRPAVAERGHRRGDAAGDAKVVLLHEDRVVQAEAVVHTSAAADRIAFERAQPGCRLARVEDRGAGSLDEIDVPRCERCDPAEAAEDVERGSLAGEDRACGALDRGDSCGNAGDP